MGRCDSLLLLVGALGIAAAPSLARAQPYTAPPPPPPASAPAGDSFHGPDGIFLGGAVGLGNMTFTPEYSDSSIDFGSVFYEAHFGGMLTERIALVVELWGSVHSFSQDESAYDAGLSQVNLGVGGQYWFTPKLWGKAAVGMARLKTVGCPDPEPFNCGPPDVLGERRGFGGFGALGYEILHRQNWAIDISLQLGGAGYKDQSGSSAAGSLNAGFTWFN